MGFGWETLAVGAIVGAALVWAARGIWRAGRRKQMCTSCGAADACPLARTGESMGDPGLPCSVTPPGERAADADAADADRERITY